MINIHTEHIVQSFLNGDNAIIQYTEWNKKGASWSDDNPWSWENYYIWENNNLITIEDYAGNKTPTYVYKYSYSSVSGVQNVQPIHLTRFQYFPLQLKGYFGAQTANLIIGIENIHPNASNSEITYQSLIPQHFDLALFISS